MMNNKKLMTVRTVTLLLTAVCLIAGMPAASAQDAGTIVYVDALWCRVHAADCPDLILKDQKQTMTLGEADQLGYRIGESGQSGRTDCCLQGYTRQHPLAVIEEDAMGVLQIVSGNTKYHVHGCHRFRPNAGCTRDTLANARSKPGFYLCIHCEERGPGFAQMSDEEWAKLPSAAPWVPPGGWTPSSFPTDTLPPQEEINILLSQAQHGDLGIQDRVFINPVATVDNFVIMRFFFPVGRWLELYQAYRCTGDEGLLEKMRESARHYNTLSTNYLSAAQYKARDPEGMAYMYSMAASARITMQLALKYPAQVTAGEVAEAEEFLMTIISVLQPVCEDNSNLDPQMGIPKPLADDFRSRAFNRALNGIGTIGMATAALQDLQVLNSTTAYQSTIDRYRKVIQEYIKNWKSTGFEETVDGKDYFSYPYSAGDSGSWDGDVKLFSADDQGHFSHSMQGCYVLYDSVPELGVDDTFMTAIANTIEFNSYTTSGSPQTPSQEAIRSYSRKSFAAPRDRFYLLQAFNDGVIAGQCSKLSASATESANSGYEYRRATLNAYYLKALRQDRTLIHMGEESVAPPAPPTGLVAIGSDESVSLDWDDNSEGDLDSYSVYRSTTSGSGYALVTNGLSSSSYIDNAVVNNTMYFYVVTATDTNSQVSANSSEVSAAPFIPDATPPAAPTGLGAAATDGSVSLDWADNGEGDFNSYNIYRSATSGSYGTPLATNVNASEIVDADVVNGTTYTYVVTAVDHSGNESAQSSEISATPQAFGPTITFGLNHDGDGGFGTSVATGTEVWSLTADSLNYAFGVLDTDEGHTASLLKSYEVNRSAGASYTFESVVDLTDGYGDDNNRIGLLLFNDTSSQTGDGGGLYLRLNTDGHGITIEQGINGSPLDSGNTTGAYSGDSWIGQTLKFTADLVFTNVAGTDKIDVTFTLTDGDLHTDTLTAQVDAASYTGTYFGFATKWRQRGDGGSRDTPPVIDYRTFSFINHTAPDVDTTPPAAPTGLSAIGGNGEVSLGWNDNGESDLATYSVYRSTTSGSYGSALEAGLSSSDYIDDTAVNGNTYYYMVTATDTNGNESAQSSETSATPTDTTPPAAPTGLTATAGDGEVALDWNNNGEGDLAGYSVYRSTASGSYGAALVTDVITSAYVDSTAVNGTTYYYMVTAVDAADNESAQSGEDSATPQIDVTPPAAPTGLAAWAGYGSTIALDWNDNGEGDLDSYSVYRSTTSGSHGAALATGLSSSQYTDRSAVLGTAYYYVVTAVDARTNESVQSAEVSATPVEFTDFSELTIFGSSNDGVGGFSASATNGTEVWSLTTNSLNYAFGVLNVDEAHTASLLKSYEVNRYRGASCTFEGVVDLTAGYGDDNNRIGMLLFNDTSSQTSDGGGLYLRLNTDGREIAIKDGLNGYTLASAGATGDSSGDSWIGQTLKFTVDLVFTNIGGTDKIDVTFTLTDGDLHTDTLTARVDAAGYSGTYCGFLTKWRQRGTDGSDRNAPPIFDYRSFSVTDNCAPALEGYEKWLSAHEVADTAENFHEYAMGSDPTDGLAPTNWPVLSNTGSGFLFIHPQRSDDTSLIYTVETTTNLMDSGSWANEGYVVLGTNITDNTLNFVTNEVDTAGNEKFIRLKIER